MSRGADRHGARSVGQNAPVRALTDFLSALRGTITVALRRAHPSVMIGCGLGVVALALAGLYVAAGDPAGPGAGSAALEPGGDDTADPAAGGPASDASGATDGQGRPLINGMSEAAARSRGVAVAGAGDPFATGEGGGSVAGAPAVGEAAGDDGAGAGGGEGAPATSSSSSTTDRTTTTGAGTTTSTIVATTPTTAAPHGDGGGGLVGGLLDVLGLG